MKERPILMSAPMVRALLDGNKTQTRRIMKPQPQMFINGVARIPNKRLAPSSYHEADRSHIYPTKDANCPYGQPGDRLYVKETWAAREEQDHLPPSECDDTGLWWRASMTGYETGYAACHGKWRPSIFMPRWASRILLEITDVRVERLHNITPRDAMAEGVEGKGTMKDVVPNNGWRMSYRDLWESINGAGSWDANPWVWVVAFEVCHDRP